MKGTELVLKALKDKGVKYIFGYTGGAIMPIFDEMEKQKCFEFIMSRHEQGAAFMAQGISRASAGTSHLRTGVCMATSGPGAINLVTAIADAIMDSCPLLAITGQVATGVIATDAFQESDVVGVMMPITKQTYMPLPIDKIEETIHETMYVALTGRGGPVVVDIPKDIQLQETGAGYQFNPETYEPDLPGFLYSPSPDRDSIHLDRLGQNHNVEILDRQNNGVVVAQVAGTSLMIDNFMAGIGQKKIIEVARSGFTALEK